MEVPSMWTPSCPEPDSNQDPCHDDGREHRPGEDEDDQNYDDNDDESIVLLVKEEKYKTFLHLALKNKHKIKHTNNGEIKLIKESI